MRKNIVLFAVLTLIPYVLCIIFSLFNENIRMGQGDNSLRYHLLGKDILIEVNGLYKSMDVEEYVKGVLPGTISAEYDEEALKVQAILIRTNVLKEIEEKGSSDASDLSYDYLTVEERIDLFGERNYERYEQRFEQAVVGTAGQVLRQEGNLIMALYHEVSIGKTASATEVLGEDIAYLQSVDSSQDVEAKHYMNIVNYTWEELQSLDHEGKEVATAEVATTESAPTSEGSTEVVEGTATEAPATETATTEKPAVQKMDIKVTESTENGFVKQLSVDGTVYTGEEAMEKYGLSSSNFYVEEVQDGIRFVCLGKGNCMGLSQYGANCMALEGKSAKDIIDHYYKKVSIEDYHKK